MKLFHGDCLEIMPSLAAQSIDLIFADLPYGTTQCSWDVILPFDKLWVQFERLIKPHGSIIFTASQPFTSLVVQSKIDWFQVEWIWAKNAGSNFGNLDFQPMKEHESVLVFAPHTPLYHPIFQERTNSGKARVKTPIKYQTQTPVYGKYKPIVVKRPELRYPSSIQKFNRERGLHPTQKPVALLEYLIKTYSDEGATVLDPVMGSGTTLVACQHLNRFGVGIELQEEYFKTAQKRIQEDKND